MPPADIRIQQFLNEYLADVCPRGAPRLPDRTLPAIRSGQAREWSFPAGKDFFESPYVKSYRVAQGVLHNPVNDRRTTQGVFHIAEGGLPIPADKIAVPKSVFAGCWRGLDTASPETTILPYSPPTSPPAVFVSLLLRPLVCPETPGPIRAKTMETRFFAPGSLVSNLDFVEGIFGNGRRPVPARKRRGAGRDALDRPHGLRHPRAAPDAHSQEGPRAAARQRGHRAPEARRHVLGERGRSSTTSGRAFKVTRATPAGVIVTVIADTYFGYCKKEVKTQISFSANLFGIAEEEHSGGALVFASYVLGQEFHADRASRLKPATLDEPSTRPERG